MQYGNIGLFYGGELTKVRPTNAIHVSAFLVKTTQGMFGVGEATPARSIRVSFNQPEPDFTITHLSSYENPVYELRVPASAGEAFVVFDPAKSEISVVWAPNSTMPIFARLHWDAGATSVDDVTIDYGPRQISRVAESKDPIRPEQYYHNTMDFSDARFNDPLVSFGIMGNVLQGESRARLGSSYAYSTLRGDDIVPGTNSVTFKPFEVFIRERHDGQDVYRHVDTKQEEVLTFPNFAIDWTNCTIHVGMHPETGALVADKNIQPRVTLADDSEVVAVPLAYVNVPAGAVGMADLQFVVVSDSTGNNLQTGTEVWSHQLAHPSGFVKPFEVTIPEALNSIQTVDNGLFIQGVLVKADADVVNLGPAPALGDRLDFVYAKVRRVLYPTVPQDGSFYTQLAGSGYAVMQVEFMTVHGVPHNRVDEIMRLPVETFPELGWDPAAEGDGSYTKTDISSFGGRSWAVPVMFLSRFSKDEGYTVATPWGGTGRPDGKTHDRVHLDEVELCAPVVRLNSAVSDARILGEAMDAVLRGEPTQMARGGVSGYPSPFSKHPLQVDALSIDPVPGAHMLTPPNGLRRQWTAQPRPYWMSTSFDVKGNLEAGDYSNGFAVYDHDARELTLHMPTGTILHLQGGEGGVPEISLRWTHNGLDVVIEPIPQEGGPALPFVVSSDRKSMTLRLSNAGGSGFPNAETVLRAVVAVKVISLRDTHLKETPAELLRAEWNGAPAIIANEMVALDYVQGIAGEHIVMPIGHTEKGEASTLLLRQTAAADTKVFTFATSYEGRAVHGIQQVDLLGEDGRPVSTRAIAQQRFVGGNLEVTLFDTVPANAGIEAHVALAGRIVNVRPDVNGIYEFGEAMMVTGQASGGDIHHVVLRAPAIPSAGEFATLLGAFAYVNDNDYLNTSFGVLVDGEMFPAVVSGFGTNMMTVSLSISAADHGMMKGNKANWHVAPSGRYVLNQGVQFQVPCLLSAALEAGDDFQFFYKGSALGFHPVSSADEFEIVHRGYVIASSDSIANQSDSHLSPIAERFPLTRGGMYAPDITPTTSVRDAALSFEQNGILPMEGTRFKVNGRISMGVYIDTPQSGVVAWIALVRRGHDLHVFTYVIDEGPLLVNNPARAFLSRPLTPYVI